MNYSRFDIGTLKTMCEHRGIAFSSSSSKIKLIELLEEHDEVKNAQSKKNEDANIIKYSSDENSSSVGTDFSKFDKDTLLNMCKHKGIYHNTSMAKSELIQILVDNEKRKFEEKSNRSNDYKNFNNDRSGSVSSLYYNEYFDKYFNGPYCRGKKHDTVIAFFIWLGSVFASYFIVIGSFFYWPLARNWLNIIGEYIWTWVFYLGMILTSFVIWLYIVIFAITIICIPISVLMFFWWKSIISGYRQAIKNRELYVSHYN